ncbi:MAG: CBS domain-containing protein [Candidatus Omnitrophica bacterium]|nr:CBS domain-containing protein [Candidatus Omnitrophota bacterium]MDD5574193.1 CBS domain-containing protein [Candidatus Omnitrophota bacterium]
MKIGEIMTRDVETLSPDTTAIDAMRRLFERQISGLPVVDGAGKLIGMFTEKDILRAILPSYVSQVGRFVYENSPKTIKCKVAKLADHKVGDLMRKEVVKIGEEVPVCEVAHIMLTQDVRRVPVVDAQDKIRGIAARSDVLNCLLKG